MENVESLNIGGNFKVICYNKDGSIEWRAVAKNSVTNAGLNNLLNVYFGVTGTIGDAVDDWGWAVGLIDNSGFSGLSNLDLHNWHPGWTEFTNYTTASNSLIRPGWVGSAAASATIGNSGLIDFGVTRAGILEGLFIVGGTIDGASPASSDADYKGGSSSVPVLWATSRFSIPETVKIGNVIRVTYAVSAQSG